MYSNFAPGADHVARLQEMAGAGDVRVVRDEAGAIAAAPLTQVVFGHRWLRQLLPHAPALRWVQTSAGGYDQLPWQELRARGVVLTRNPANSEAIAQHALALAWALQRRLPQAFAAQARGEWASPFAMLAAPRQALVLGLGAIGSEIARLLRGLGVRVRGCARRAGAAHSAACDEFVAAEHWCDALADTDLLVVALPLDATTRGCIGARELAALPAHALVVNVAREAIVERAALVDALRAGRLGGAATDLLDPVPPPDDPLWTTPNLLITPKVAAYHPDLQSRFEAFAEAQLRRWLAGEPLVEAVAWSQTPP